MRLTHALNAIKSLRDDRSGVAMLELALLSPVLAMITLGGINYSMQVTSELAVQSAAREGAAYAVAKGFISTSIANAVTGNSRNAAFLTAITADPAPSRWYGCANSAAAVTASTSGATCTNGQKAGQYVTVSAKATFTPPVPWLNMEASNDITSSVTVRIS